MPHAKRVVLSLTLILLATAAVRANGLDADQSAAVETATRPQHSDSKAPSGSSGRPGHASWRTDYKQAIAEAAETNRLVLLFFTGSDWCLWCRKLDNELFSQDAFQSGIGKHAVTVALDFPQRRKLPPSQARQNQILKQRWQVEAFPTVIVIDPTAARELWRHSYIDTTPQDYLAALAAAANTAPATP